MYPLLRGKTHGQVKRSHLAKDWASSYTRARIPAPDGVLVGTWALSWSPHGVPSTRSGQPCPGSFFTTGGSKGGAVDTGKLRELEFRQVQGLSHRGVPWGGLSWVFGSSESKSCVADVPRLRPGSTTQQCDLGQVISTPQASGECLVGGGHHCVHLPDRWVGGLGSAGGLAAGLPRQALWPTTPGLCLPLLIPTQTFGLCSRVPPQGR